MSDEIHSLDEWILENEMEDLVEEIESHLEDFIDDTDQVSDLTRMIMISMRQNLKLKGFSSEE